MKPSNGFMPDSMAGQEMDSVPLSNDKMASNNVSAAGDIMEFSLAPITKSKTVPLFKQTALYKYRLKLCIFLHFCLFLTLFCKLSEDILDRMDIFILEIEELFIPKPLVIEYVYASGIMLSFVAIRALSHNLGGLKSYAAGIVVFCICPLFLCGIYFLNDVLEYAEKKDQADIEKWRDFPIALIYYGYILVALQIHFFSIYYSAKLIKIWKTKMKRF